MIPAMSWFRIRFQPPSESVIPIPIPGKSLIPILIPVKSEIILESIPIPELELCITETKSS